jgi:hypothetical protein
MDQSTLAELFTEQAEWRAAKAAEFPDDKRNIDAVGLHKTLAQTSADVPDDLLHAAAELCEDAPDIEVWNEMLRQVGFQSSPTSATQFVQDFVAARVS